MPDPARSFVLLRWMQFNAISRLDSICKHTYKRVENERKLKNHGENYELIGFSVGFLPMSVSFRMQYTNGELSLQLRKK